MFSKFFIDRPIFATVLALLIVVAGLVTLGILPIAQYPDITPPTVQVSAVYPGANAQTVAQTVGIPIEQQVNGVDGMLYMSSNSSSSGAYSLTITFAVGTDIDMATVQVQNRVSVAQSSLPTPVVVQGVTVQKQSSNIVMFLTMTSDSKDYDGLYLSNYAKLNLVDQLTRVPGVGAVNVMGAGDYSMRIWLDPAAMRIRYLSPADVYQAIQSQNVEVSAGNVGQPIGTDNKNAYQYSLTVKGRLTSPEEFGNIILRTETGGKILRLRDVAHIDDAPQERAQEAYTNGELGGMIIVQKQSGANSVEISKAVKARLTQIAKNLPSDVHIGLIVDTSDYIINTIESLKHTILITMLIVSFVVLLFLGRWRATFVIVLTIPISLLSALIYLLATGNTMNIISMSALSIAIGMVVDNAIVVLENITTHIERGSRPRQAAMFATNEVAISVIASTLTTIAVFLPLTMISGMAGIMFKQLGWMVTIILSVSTIGAITLTPTLCSLMLRLDKKYNLFQKMVSNPFDAFLKKVTDGYAALLRTALRHRWATLAIIVGLFVASIVVLMPHIKTEFFPQQDNSRIGITVKLPAGTRQETTRALGFRIYEQLKSNCPEVTTVSFSEGQAGEDNIFGSMQDNGNNILQYNISTVRSTERERSLSEICDAIRHDLNQYPEIRTFNVAAGGGGGGIGGEAAVEIEIYGYDFTTSDRIASDVSAKMLSEDCCSQVSISRDEYTPEYRVDFDRQKLALNGLNMQTAASYLRNRVTGSALTNYREDGDEYKIRVRYDKKFRQSVEDIENITIYNSQGKGIKIRDLGKVVESQTPPTIERRDRERVITVKCIVAKGYALSDVVKAANKAMGEIDMPADFTWQFGGTFEDQQDTFTDMIMLMALIIVLVFIIMASQFESLTYPFVIMFSIPFALTGVLMGLFVTGTPLSIMAMLGLLMLIGIVVNNGIVLIDYIMLCRERGLGLVNAIVTSGRSRLRPILMTTLTTVIGMIPMAVGKGEGSEMWRALGMSVAWGLSFSTLITLIIIPTLYSVFARIGIKRARKKELKTLKK